TKPPHSLPLPPGDDWPPPALTILHSLPDDMRGPADQGQPATYRNTETHWWDASQVYGSALDAQRAVRTDPGSGKVRADGKIHLDAQGHLPVDPIRAGCIHAGDLHSILDDLYSAAPEEMQSARLRTGSQYNFLGSMLHHGQTSKLPLERRKIRNQ